MEKAKQMTGLKAVYVPGNGHCLLYSLYTHLKYQLDPDIVGTKFVNDLYEAVIAAPLDESEMGFYSDEQKCLWEKNLDVFFYDKTYGNSNEIVVALIKRVPKLLELSLTILIWSDMTEDLTVQRFGVDLFPFRNITLLNFDDHYWPLLYEKTATKLEGRGLKFLTHLIKNVRMPALHPPPTTDIELIILSSDEEEAPMPKIKRENSVFQESATDSGGDLGAHDDAAKATEPIYDLRDATEFC